jgi:hypothetical protein
METIKSDVPLARWWETVKRNFEVTNVGLNVIQYRFIQVQNLGQWGVLKYS